MTRTKVDDLYNEYKLLQSFLNEKSEISYAIYVGDIFRKIMVIAAASYFEEEIKDILTKFAEKKSGKNQMLISFLRNKAIERQYHTYFSWKENNANLFFSLFGDEFKIQAKSDVNKKKELEGSIKAFMEIGRSRNLLAHQNFASYTLEKTAKEVYNIYDQAKFFIEYLKKKFK